MNDLEKSEQIVAAILDRLYENGLREISIYGKHFTEVEQWDDYALFRDCLNWLQNEGIIRFRSIDEDGADFCNLTSAGFALLGRSIKVGDTSERASTIAAKYHRKEMRFGEVGDFLGSLIGGFTKSISS